MQELTPDEIIEAIDINTKALNDDFCVDCQKTRKKTLAKYWLSECDFIHIRNACDTHKAKYKRELTPKEVFTLRCLR